MSCRNRVNLVQICISDNCTRNPEPDPSSILAHPWFPVLMPQSWSLLPKTWNGQVSGDQVLQDICLGGLRGWAWKQECLPVGLSKSHFTQSQTYKQGKHPLPGQRAAGEKKSPCRWDVGGGWGWGGHRLAGALEAGEREL